jgi:hypothetical protein
MQDPSSDKEVPTDENEFIHKTFFINHLDKKCDGLISQKENPVVNLSEKVMMMGIYQMTKYMLTYCAKNRNGPQTLGDEKSTELSPETLLKDWKHAIT